MKRLRFCAVLALAAALSGCHTMRGAPHRGGRHPAPAESVATPPASDQPQPESPQQDTSNPEEPNSDVTPPADANAAALAPCLPIDDKAPKIKVKPKSVRKKAPPPLPAPQVPETPADGIIDARVEPLPVSVMSILGKKVQSPKGDDLGRVVDVLADSGGHVRVAIIDFGGFLGVGNRRIAVDWPLLRFNPDRRDPSLVLSLSREKLQAAPEYKDNPRPQALMVPAPDAAPAAPATAPSGFAAAPAGSAAAPPGPAAAGPPAKPAPSAAPPPASDPKK